MNFSSAARVIETSATSASSPPPGPSSADDLDDEVDVRERQREAAQQVRALLGLLQVELRPPDDDDSCGGR